MNIRDFFKHLADSFRHDPYRELIGRRDREEARLRKLGIDPQTAPSMQRLERQLRPMDDRHAPSHK